MPWHIERRNNQYCVIADSDGSQVACHRSRFRATRQLRALYANEPSARQKDAPNYSARAGETIRGNLARGADGKFTAAGNAGKPAPKPAEKPPTAKPKPKPGQKPKATPRKASGRSAEAAARRRQRLIERAQREAEKKRLAEEKRQQGLDKAVQRYQRDEGRRRERDQAAGKREMEKRQREVARELRRREVEQRRQQKPGGGGAGKGGGGKKPGSQAPGLSPALTTAARRLSAGQSLDQEDQDSLVRNGLARRDRDGNLILTAAGLRETREKEIAMLQVFKDQSNRYRWIALSSNAFRDRDGEIVATKALEEDVTLSDQAGIHGPLRFWHVPGLDLGTCDFRAVDGRMLIESGTFHDEAIGAAVAQKAAEYQISIGFVHPHTQPDPDGVFHSIRTFERSLVPLGRAANPWTRIQVKEVHVMTTEKATAFAGLVGEERASQMLATVQQTQKEVEQAGIAFKAADVPAPVADAKADMPVEVEVEEGGDPDLAAEDTTVYIGDMTPEEFSAMLAQALSPLIGALNFETKMRGMMDELKSTMGGVVAKKDDEIAAISARMKELQERLDELSGDVPRGVRGGYRASESGPAPAEHLQLKAIGDMNNDPYAPHLNAILAAMQGG